MDSSISSADLPPPPEDAEVELDKRKLWIGNLDSRITEFAVLKLLQKHGDLEKLNFLYHKQGPDYGKPRGFCFVTYKTLADAEKAKKNLNGKLALKKRLIVRNAKKESFEGTQPSTSTPANTANGISTTNISAQINAIEDKLDKMQNNVESDDIPVNFYANSANKKDSVTKTKKPSTNRNRPYGRRRGRHY